MSTPRPSRSAEPASQQLSQTDIDRMMLGDAPPPQPVIRASSDVQIYDFRRPHRVSKERLHVLEAMYGRLVKSFEGWLMGRVRGLVDLRLSVLVFLGRNWARVIVMCISVLSISTVFGAWWVQGQEITLEGSFMSLAIDILLLLALSSRSAAAYARRRERP